MVGVATAVVPPIVRPELAELRTAMQSVPIEADDVGRWVACQRRLRELVDDGELLGWAASEDVDSAASPVNRIGEFVCENVRIATGVADDDVVWNYLECRFAFRDDNELRVGKRSWRSRTARTYDWASAVS